MCGLFVMVFIGFPLVMGASILYEKIVGTPASSGREEGPWWGTMLFAILLLTAVMLTFSVANALGC